MTIPIDGVWMATIGGDDSISEWVERCGGASGNDYEMWDDDEICAETDIWVEDAYLNHENMVHSPDTSDSDVDSIFTNVDDSGNSSE